MKQTKKLLSLTLAILMLLTVVCSALGEGSYVSQPVSAFAPVKTLLPAENGKIDPDWAKQSDAVLNVRTVAVYPGTLDKCRYTKVADVRGYEDVPFLSLRDYLTGLFNGSVSFYMDVDNTRFLMNRNGVTAELTKEPLALNCDNWDWFFGRSDGTNVPNGVLTSPEMLAIRDSEKTAKTFTTVFKKAISLEYDGIGAVWLDNDVLLPFGILQNIFAASYSETEQYLLWNGDDFYFLTDSFENQEATRTTPYEAAYYTGSLAAKTEATPAYAKYNYACVCLLIDNFFGHKAEKNFDSFDALAVELGLKENLLSTQPEVYLSALKQIVFKYFDSAHDSLAGIKGIFGAAIRPEEENMVVTGAEAGEASESADGNTAPDSTDPAVQAELEKLVQALFSLGYDATSLSDATDEDLLEAKAISGVSDEIFVLFLSLIEETADTKLSDPAIQREMKKLSDALADLGYTPQNIADATDADILKAQESSGVNDEVVELWKINKPYIYSAPEEEVQLDANEILLEVLADKVGVSVLEIYRAMIRMAALRPEEYAGGTLIAIEDDTAFIYFEKFVIDLNRPESFYSNYPSAEEHSSSSFTLFYNAFEEIRNHPEVKNVVIDLSNNSGGAVSALVSILGFMSPDGESQFSYLDMRDDNYRTETFHIDTNLDGKFDDEDGYGGEYNFYILTSPLAYSCGNALPYFAQKYGYAKIIGEKPSGGDCAVQMMLDAYGFRTALSGYLKLGLLEEDGTFVSDETAVTVDIPFGENADQYYFNRPAIVELIHAQK